MQVQLLECLRVMFNGELPADPRSLFGASLYSVNIRCIFTS